MPKNIYTRVLTVTLVLLLAAVDLLGAGSALPANAEATPAIALNGTVTEGEAGVIDSKTSILSSSQETRVTYRLTPSYSSGEASGVQVHLYLPSLMHVDGEYRVVGRDQPPTPLGVQGTVSSGGGWTVKSDSTVRGGPLIVEYDGNLGPGSNPAFDVLVTTYNDGTDGPYGGIPEGTALDIQGYVSYEVFNGVPGSSWETPHQFDESSAVKLISSDLTWEADIDAYTPNGETDVVPIWDRYQYIDYVYTISNTSENVASNIDGYSVTFNIDSTDSNPNGIIPFDINRWIYTEGETPTENTDVSHTAGEFVGVPGKGGVLIYDVTEWDGESQLTDPIPYTYSGTGMISIDREKGEHRQGLTPEAAPGDTERNYLISIPLSRQGFPNPPALFKVSAVTNIVFAENANWSKTSVKEREIVWPQYDFSFTHTTKQDEVVYGYETYNEIADLYSASNAPVFNPKIEYQVAEHFEPDRVVYELEYEHLEEFEDASIRYAYIDADTSRPTEKELFDYTLQHDADTGVVTLTFDVSHLNELDWDRRFTMYLGDRIEKESSIPVSIKVYGSPYELGTMEATAEAIFVEKIASNDDYGNNTSYTEVEHVVSEVASFEVVYPDEVVPDIEVHINGSPGQATVPYRSETEFDIFFGLNDTVALNSTTTLDINRVDDDAGVVEALKQMTLAIHGELFARAENVRVRYETLDGETGVIDLSDHDGESDVVTQLPEGIANIVIDTDEFRSAGKEHFVTVTAVVENGLAKEHTVTAELRTYQPKPYDQDRTAEATGTVTIQLPNELVPAVDVVGVYGDLATPDKTRVSYESTFDVEYKLDTGGVGSPSYEYVIEMLDPSGAGELVFTQLKLEEAYLQGADHGEITLVDETGARQTFSGHEITASDLDLGSITQIIITGKNIRLDALDTIATVSYNADIEMGSTQQLAATFNGDQEAPYEEEKTATAQNTIEVHETQTAVKVEGVNQVTKGLGVGNDYTVEIYKHWAAGTTYAKKDYTLDQGYKSLGGFTSTLTRPTDTFANNDQSLSIDVELPHEHFDLYYVKIREEMRPYLESVDIYRVVDGKEELWKTVPGDQWENNTQEGTGFWRIATARPDISGAELFDTYDSVTGVAHHPYYKDAWDEDVQPASPVSRVALNLEFTREGNAAAPQMGGIHNDVVEYMGRFHSSSVQGKKHTVLTAEDTFGVREELTRTDSHSVESLVGYPYAQTRTGANDSTSLKNKVIPMGNVGEYLASIWNVTTEHRRSYYRGHGPDVYTPAETEYDEWLGERDPSSFHDTLIYEFVYPASPNRDDVYNFDAQYFTIPDSSTLKYLTGVRVWRDTGLPLEIHFTDPLTEPAVFEYDHSADEGIIDNGDGTFSVALGGEEVHPTQIEAIFSEVPGYGERTAEIDGAEEDRLGANLNEIDVRIGGIVNGNRALQGTTNLYRMPDDTQEKTLVHSSNATLTGYTPKLGASLEMDFDSVKVYDYQADGITPNTTQVTLGIKNASEADINGAEITFTPDKNFRSQLIEIPSDIFAEDWSVESVIISQGNQQTQIELERFDLNEEGNYQLKLADLFNDGTLTTEAVNVTLGGEATLNKQNIDSFTVAFAPKDDTVGMWGSFTRGESSTELPTRMREGGDIFVTGTWVDEDSEGPNWNSKPTFVSERTKASNEVRTAYSSFNVKATVTSYHPLYTSASGSNNGEHPTLTRSSSANSTAAPRLYNRVAQLNAHATHLTNDFNAADNTNLFYDADTDAQINYTNIAVGDTTKVLYELRNTGKSAEADDAGGALPVFDPVAHIIVPQGLTVTEVQAATSFIDDKAGVQEILDLSPNRFQEIQGDEVTRTNVDDKRVDLRFDTVLNDGESVYFYVEYTAVNDFGEELVDTQNKTVQWSVYTHPAYTHHFMSYDSTGVSGNRVTGDTATQNLDGDNITEHHGRLRNTNYRFANPNQLIIHSEFDEENVSGEEMTLTVQQIRNEILHDNTVLDLFITLDRESLGGFELTDFPAPEYPAGFAGEYLKPQVLFFVPGTGEDPGTWVAQDSFDADTHQFADINRLWVQYGTVPAEYGEHTFEAPEFTIPGIGHWKSPGNQSTKNYNLYSEARIELTHKNGDTEAAKYTYQTNDMSRVWKAIPTVEFNIQAFDTPDEAQAEYDGSRVGKANYVAGDDIHYKITAKNHSSNQGTNTNTAYGKAPLRHPVVFDKIPEYLTTEFSQYINNGVFDVEQAIANGLIDIRVYGEDGETRSFVPPEVTVETVTGLDIAGAQIFSKNRHNDGYGLPSSAPPSDITANPAEKINFEVFTYSFLEEDLGRGERLEIVYSAKARTTDLPYATYEDGTSVFAPMFGWYGNNTPVASNANNTSMDMATLLHDAGISGDKGHEMTAEEFLSNSYSWQPGAANGVVRRTPINSSNSTQVTFYDATADTERTHPAYLRETATNDLFPSFAAGTTGRLDDNFAFAAYGRFNDGKVTLGPERDERILWAQQGMQLNRAWLYGASEMVPDREREPWDVSEANFYEHDGSLNSYNRHRLGYTPYVEDDYTYAVELHEQFTVKLHAANLGDRSVESGIEYLEILPPGITPYGEDGQLLGVQAYSGQGKAIPSTVQVVQTPEKDLGYRSPAQSQESETYAEDRCDTQACEGLIPYVVKVQVAGELQGMFNSPASSVTDKYQRVELQVRVYEELPPAEDGLSYWYDELTVTTIEPEEYLETYSKEHGGFDRAIGTYNPDRYPNHGMADGIDRNSTAYRFGAYTSYFSFEPYGMYIRGLNARGTATQLEGKPALVTGDQIAMRKPTLRVWSAPSKDQESSTYDQTIENFNVNLYEEFTLHSTVENQQLEVLGEYNRVHSGYNRYTGDYYNDDIWVNAPQTIGGARGSWFEPTVTIALPYGIAPVMEDGTYGRYYRDLDELQDVQFSATVNSITYDSSTVKADVSEFFDVAVERVTDDEHRQRFVMHFTVNEDRAADIAYGQSLVISPRVTVIDTPHTGEGDGDTEFQEILTLANTKRPVFNAIVSDEYTTGSPPSVTARDLGQANTGVNSVKSFNGRSISENDRTRRDSSSVWKTNEGFLGITERLISATDSYSPDTPLPLHNKVDGSTLWQLPAEALLPTLPDQKHEKAGAYGGTVLHLKHPSITNTTAALNHPEAHETKVLQVDAAGKYWYATNIRNSVTPHENPAEEIKTSGDVVNSRFLITQYVTNFAEPTGELRIKIDDAVYDSETFTRLGYSIQQVHPHRLEVDAHRNRVQWLVTPPANERGTYGELLSGENFTVLSEMQLVEGYEENVADDDAVWSADELIIDSFVSLIPDDVTLIDGDQDERDFIVQDLTSITYHEFVSDESTKTDIDSNGDFDGRYAHDTARIEIRKPKAEIRVNTTRPRIAYSNGMSGDTYFNASDTIEYLVTHAKVTGSGLKELAVENVLPAHETNDSTVQVSNAEITTRTLYASTGAWELPEETLQRLQADGKSVDEVFATYLYISHELAEDGYETEGWTLLNPGGSSLQTNETFEFSAADRPGEIRKIRVVVRSLDPNNYLVPKGTRLDVDADPETDGKQDVTETDPDNDSTESYPDTVLDSAIKVGMRVSSDAKSTLFLYFTGQIWGNYVGTSVSKLDQSVSRSYLTPSRPVMNVTYDSKYYRPDSGREEHEKFGWSEVSTIAPTTSRHLKFRGQFTNADDTMWSRDEDNIYASDLLIDPFVTFQLPAVMETGGEFTYIPNEELTADNPLSDDYRSRYALSSNTKNLWTFKIVKADGSEADEDSHLTYKDLYAGPWTGFDRNIVSIWFEGQVEPGDKIVVEFLGIVDAYSPGTNSDALKSRAMITNNTGLLQPLNSQQNSSNRLGYTLDDHDFNSNGMKNDRLVFAERTLFRFETYDDFGKRKVAYSNLNRAGTVAPEITPVEQGGTFSFEISVDNSKGSHESPYPYPILYDVLPFAGDTSITNEDRDRGSNYEAWLLTEGMQLELEGENAKVFNPNEYTVFVGPLTKEGNEIVPAKLPSHSEAATQKFYDSLGTPGQISRVRDAHFVKLDEVAEDEELLKQVTSVLVMLNEPEASLPGQNKLKFTYHMKSPLNAPAFLEQFENEERRSETALWNSFMATQGVSGFLPQESNNAGVFATEQQDLVYIGNYVWNDVNYNGEQDEGTSFVDNNGRTHLQPSKDLNYDGKVDDPGINGVRVSLLTPRGYNVDELGNPIHQVDDGWFVVDEATGETVIDEVFGQPVSSEGPLITHTETDFYGHEGYYTFSNIQPGDYRVMFEFPSQYNTFSATTTEVFDSAQVEIFYPGEKADLPAAADDSVLVTITDPTRVDADTSDEDRMSFDMGIAEMINVGGTIFKEDHSTLNGYQDDSEPGIEGYHVHLKHMDGTTVTDPQGSEMVAITDAQGEYEFSLLPIDREYYIEVTDHNDEFNEETIVSPIVHNSDPFAEAHDNDGFTEQGTTVVKTTTMDFSLEGLFATDFADRMSVSVGFYDRTTYGVIGNRVWHDVNRDGVQDPGEPGIPEQQLHLEQYILEGDTWQKTDFSRSTTSNADGYYYFTEVPAVHREGSGSSEIAYETKYQVVVDEVAQGYTFTTPNVGDDERDSDFYRNGTMHQTEEVGEHLVSLVEYENGIAFGIDNNTIDLGLVPHALSSLEGEVFIDADGNGIKDDEVDPDNIYTATLEVKHDGEWSVARQAANGVMIEPASATAADETISLTGVNEYRFDKLHIIDSAHLTPYEYRVRVTQIPLWEQVTELRAGSDDSVDNDFRHAHRDQYSTAVSEAYLLGELEDGAQLQPINTFEGVPAEHVDLGLVRLDTTATIGDFIWYDVNADGIQDADESGVEGLRVAVNRLVNGELVFVDETFTDEHGYYEFTLEAADRNPDSQSYNTPHEYVVEFELASRQTLSPQRVGADNTVNSKFEMLFVGGIAKYQHSLADPTHTAVSEKFSTAKKDWSGYADYATVSDDLTIDGGVINHKSLRVIGDTLFEDRNANGMQDGEEPGIADLTVKLFRMNKDTQRWEPHTDANGQTEMVTDAGGNYEFVVEVADFDKGSPFYREAEEYRVLAEAPAHMRLVEVNNAFSYQSSSNVDGIQIDTPYSSVLTEPMTLVETDGDGILWNTASDILTADAGFHVYDTSVVIAGKAWDDTNHDGLQGEDEDPIAGQVMTLWEKIGDEWVQTEDLDGNETVVTDESGYYSFIVSPTHYDESKANFLAPREYVVTTQREGFQAWSPLNVGNNHKIDSDVRSSEGSAWAGNRHLGVTRVFDIADLLPDSEQQRVDVSTVRNDRYMDFGITTFDSTAVIGGTVWDDLNNDGVFDANERPIEGQEVTLWRWQDDGWVRYSDLNGNFVVDTDAHGSYRFTVEPTNYDQHDRNYLVPYRYVVTVEREGYQAFSPVSDDPGDEVVNTVQPSTDTQWEDNVHLGFSREYSTIETGENGAADVSTLHDDTDDFLGITSYANTAMLGGVIWHDSNENHVRDDAEPLLEGREVTLWVRDGEEWIVTEDVSGNSVSVTDALGRYDFEVPVTSYDRTASEYLQPLEYRVSTKREGYEKWVEPHYSGDALVDSDLLPGQRPEGFMSGYDLFDTDESGRIVIDSLRNDFTKDAGVRIFESTTHVGGTVWDDVNEDGVQQFGEAGLPNQTVGLWELVDGEWESAEDVHGDSMTVTDEAGRFEFEVLPAHYDETSVRYMQPRIYRAAMEVPAGYELSEGSASTFLERYVLVTRNADLVTFDEQGEVDVELTAADLGLDFPVTQVPVAADQLPSTGGVFNAVYALLLLASGAVFMVFEQRRRRTQQRKEG